MPYNTKFFRWLSLYTKETTAKSRALTMGRLFEVTPLTIHTFATEETILAFITQYLLVKDPRLAPLHKLQYAPVVQDPASEGEDDSEEDSTDTITADLFLRTDDTFTSLDVLSTRSNTTSMKINTLYWYSLFLQKNFSKLATLKKRIQLESRHIEQSDMTTNLLNPGPLLYKYNTILSFLHQHQARVENILLEYFTIPVMYHMTYLPPRAGHNDTNTRHVSKFKKVCTEYIQPFLYLAFLMCERPVDHVSSMRFQATRKMNDVLSRQDIHNMTNVDDIKDFLLYAPRQDKSKWLQLTRLYVDKGGCILVCFLVQNKNTKHTTYRLQTYELQKTLGWYFYIYATIRENIYTPDQSLHRVFSGPAGGKWVQKHKTLQHMIQTTNLEGHVQNNENILSILNISKNHKQFTQSVKEMWFVVNVYTYVNTQNNPTTRDLRPLTIEHVHMCGNIANLGFVTSSGVSDFYVGPEWLHTVLNASDWWSALHNLEHNAFQATNIASQLYPLNHTSESFRERWYENWINIPV